MTALNAKFIHSSLALRCLKKYCGPHGDAVEIAEYTINHEEDFILGDIYGKKPDVLAFSCYIWNINMILRIAENVRKILPACRLILGGPEVSYDAEEYLAQNPFIDIIIRGEGEETFRCLVEGFLSGSLREEDVDGISYKKYGKIFNNPPRTPILMDALPFVYDTFEGLENRIVYYESQRGCPYNCQYCLSSVEKGVRFLSEERVKRDLRVFLDKGVRQVKFVDRTFNCNKRHAMMIWRFLMENDNGKTNFHMEITAELLDDECLKLLREARKGLFQFEIGVQSTNERTICAIQRNTSFGKLVPVVEKIKAMGNIHQHLDLIAGLPYEDYESFKKSFDDVYSLSPEQFQLGFLKLLRGSGLRRDASKYGIVYQSMAPYEVLYTAELDYEQMLRLKGIEEMVEIYYNSGKALNTLKFLIPLFCGAFALYEKLSTYWKEKNFHRVQHSKMELFTILYEFCCSLGFAADKMDIIKELLRLDIYIGDNVKTLPDWLQNDEKAAFKERKRAFFNERENMEKYLPHLLSYTPQQVGRMCHIEIFSHDISHMAAYDGGVVWAAETAILFDYYAKDEIHNCASIYKIEI